MTTAAERRTAAAEATMHAAIRAAIDAAPPLTDQQAQRIVALLTAGGE